ncbi:MULTISPECIES: YtzH-like family protein [Bacillus]|uniref:YtzH-like family protein n=1 Tax=Bacillus TaxID=1386 RepID=UPI0002D3090E|nr:MULTISPECIES: YtzH-like family protein [Bacillus]
MPLSQQHQVMVLKDILMNHQSDCCGSVSECAQVERLVTALLNNGGLNEQLIPILNEIHTYSQNGQSSSDLNGHINSYQNQLSQWVENMNQYS